MRSLLLGLLLAASERSALLNPEDFRPDRELVAEGRWLPRRLHRLLAALR